MNTRPAIDESTGPVSLTVGFNQDSSCFAVGLDTGFCVFNSDPCELKVSRDFNAGIGATEMLGKANYIALVGGGKNPKFPTHKLIIWDDAKQVAAVTLEFRSQVLQARLSRSQILVALLNSVSLYAFSSPPKKVSSFETADNPSGLCCLGSSIIAFPGRTPGQVQMVEISTGNVSIIPAHGSPLKAMTLSPNGQLLATASETGTLIRLFSTINCARISEFRRGVDPAAIFSLAISPSNALLAVTSDKATLHIFDLPHPNSTSTSRNNSSIHVIPSSRSSSPYSALDRPVSSSSSSDTTSNKQKWGILGKLPLLPRLFSDAYSFASAPIAIDDDPYSSLSLNGMAKPSVPIPGIPGGKARKGVVGWLDDSTIVVVGAGRDGRWEKFVIGNGEAGRWVGRQGWKRYLGG
ncbi:MAG: hypothetical protein LQ349_002389 [Xanthoria aureola]|nr:MAG: hypothetical protein LQ349_002389 [Xanthoria aureola]